MMDELKCEEEFKKPLQKLMKRGLIDSFDVKIEYNTAWLGGKSLKLKATVRGWNIEENIPLSTAEKIMDDHDGTIYIVVSIIGKAYMDMLKETLEK